MIQERFDSDPDEKIYRPWLRYMVFHFSGMRYKSAHGSWAEPKFILAMLSRELMEDKVRSMSELEIVDACEQAIAHLEAFKAETSNTKKIGELNRQISLLRFFNRPKALLGYLTDLELSRIEGFNEQEVLKRLEELRQANPELPPWLWQEIEKFTPLKLKTQDKNWETTSLQRWDFEDRRWREILDIWQRQDVTGWRPKHRNTLDLIVTRAVCNEIAEHIQHLRGVVPGAGLTAKPRFYNGKSQKTFDARVAELDAGEVLLRTAYSSVNYKDALAVTGRGKICRTTPMVRGIDLAGTVVESRSADWVPGDRVLVNGFGLSEKFWGGYAQKQRLKPEWLVRIPESFSAEEAMAIGTVGYTAMLCVLAIQDKGVKPGVGPVLVTGATGGVGTVAVMLLSGLGYEVVAVTGRASQHEGFLKYLGASAVRNREEFVRDCRPHSAGGKTIL